MALVEAYAKQQGLWHEPDLPLTYSERIELDLSSVVASLAGPRPPPDRVPLTSARAAFRAELSGPAERAARPGTWVDEASQESFPASDAPAIAAMTCIGASGPLIEEVAAAVRDHDLTVVSVLSGNRNFEGRIHPEVKLNYLASPPLVVAYASRRGNHEVMVRGAFANVRLRNQLAPGTGGGRRRQGLRRRVLP